MFQKWASPTSRSNLCPAVRARCSALLLIALLVGCSSNDDSAEDAARTTSTTDAPTVSAPVAEQGETETTQTAEATDVGSDTTAAESMTTSSTEAPQDDEGAAGEICGVSVAVLFDEGAPRDRLTISNESEAGIDIAAVSFDLSSSTGQIIFDTVEGGSGVEVFQDFRVEDGAAVLANEPQANDGDDSLALDFSSFGSGESFTFSIDVDDQLVDSDLGQIQVTGAEIEGATVTVELAGGADVAGTFTSDSTASATSAC